MNGHSYLVNLALGLLVIALFIFAVILTQGMGESAGSGLREMLR